MEEPSKELRFNSDTVLYMMYLMYKCNMLTRYQIKDMMKVIKTTPPDDIAKYLVEEVHKI